MIVTKAVALVDTVETDDPNGAFEVILSAATLDRDGEVIDKGAFDPLPDHIPFDIDHGMTVVTTVGSGAPYYAEDGTLRVKGTFASTLLAQEVRTLVSEGHVRTTSVTFTSAERVKDSKGVPHIEHAELLNGTFTPVPSNRESVVLSAKTADVLDDAREASLVSRLADAVSARLAGEKSAVPEQAKSIVGSLEAQRDRVQDALEDAYPRRYAYIRGVLPDTVVFDVWGDADCETYQQTYTDDGSTVTLTGQPVEVDVMEVVTPDADADGLKSADTAAVPAAEAAGMTAKSTDEDTPIEVRSAVIENAAHFAFGG
jgi:phage head maturation protease